MYTTYERQKSPKDERVELLIHLICQTAISAIDFSIAQSGLDSMHAGSRESGQRIQTASQHHFYEELKRNYNVINQTFDDLGGVPVEYYTDAGKDSGTLAQCNSFNPETGLWEVRIRTRHQQMAVTSTYETVRLCEQIDPLVAQEEC
jgi:hypothetical protein